MKKHAMNHMMNVRQINFLDSTGGTVRRIGSNLVLSLLSRSDLTYIPLLIIGVDDKILCEASIVLGFWYTLSLTNVFCGTAMKNRVKVFSCCRYPLTYNLEISLKKILPLVSEYFGYK
jgi:hypothetical protein